MPIFEIPDELVFPNPQLAEPDGLLGIGGNLSVERLLLAYENGIFPWYSEGEPIMWWSPDPRCVLFPEKLKVSKSLRQIINRKEFEVRYNTCFEEVIKHCSSAKGRQDEGTWILPETIEAYIQLHQMGYAFSVEVFKGNMLAGGLYGIVIGKVFCGESMFHLVSNASKVAFYCLVELLKQNNFKLIDCQITNDFLLSLGAEEIPREQFLQYLNK